MFKPGDVVGLENFKGMRVSFGDKYFTIGRGREKTGIILGQYKTNSLSLAFRFANEWYPIVIPKDKIMKLIFVKSLSEEEMLTHDYSRVRELVKAIL